MSEAIEQTEAITHFDMFIDGRWQLAADGGRMDVFDPDTGQRFASVPRGGQIDLDAAVESARRGLHVWRNTHPGERARILFRFAQYLREHAREIAEIEARDTGSSLGGALWTVNDVCARRFEYYAGLADKVLGDTFVAPGHYFGFTLREPVGVTAHIVPWNGPLWIGSRTIAPALAAGNAVIVKPSSEAPLSLLKLAEMAFACGVPAGVFNVVTGSGGELGDALTLHPGVDAIYFTGSGFTARRVLKNAAETFKPAVMELGGKSPNIVFADADPNAALYGALWAIFANAGQICVAGSRLLVEKRIHAEFVDRLAGLARGLKLGKEADMGPLISARQRESVLSYIAAGKSEAVLVAGGGPPGDPALAGGYYVEPTIFDNVKPDARIAREEIFGPVLAVTPFEDMDEAIAIANDTPYGLASAVWTSNVKTAHLVAERLEAAQVYVNHYYSLAYEVSRTPYKASGYGSSEGPDAIDAYLRTKTVSINLK
jgi:acyl-CoA reductase-like NAD-dependent aldehyde dehydrogenase